METLTIISVTSSSSSKLLYYGTRIQVFLVFSTINVFVGPQYCTLTSDACTLLSKPFLPHGGSPHIDDSMDLGHAMGSTVVRHSISVKHLLFLRGLQ